MANESPLMVVGGQCISTFDLRNSTFSGTTRMGPNGSGQFLACKISTVTDRVVYPSTVAGQQIFGIIQDKPAVGDPINVGIFGISKAIAGTTSIISGNDLMVDSSGCMQNFSSAAGQARVARALEAAGTVGQAFTVFIYGGGGSGTIA